MFLIIFLNKPKRLTNNNSFIKQEKANSKPFFYEFLQFLVNMKQITKNFMPVLFTSHLYIMIHPCSINVIRRLKMDRFPLSIILKLILDII